MGLRARLAGFAGVGVLVVAPILIGQQPAGAAVQHFDKSADFSFGDYQDLLVACEFSVIATFDTTAKTLNVGSTFSGSGSLGSECLDATSEFIIDYRDSHGNAQHFEATANSTGHVKASSVASNVKVTLNVHYERCNPGTNVTCTGTVVTAPK